MVRSGALVVSDVVVIQHALHTFGGRRIELPQGGATAASPFVCKNVGGLPCIEGLHLQDCIAEGTWGNESPHFVYNLSRLWNLAFLAFLAYSAFRL